MPQPTETTTPRWIAGQAEYLTERRAVANGWIAAARSQARSKKARWGVVGLLVANPLLSAASAHFHALAPIHKAVGISVAVGLFGVFVVDEGLSLLRRSRHDKALERARGLIDPQLGDDKALDQVASDSNADGFARLVALLELKTRQDEMTGAVRVAPAAPRYEMLHRQLGNVARNSLHGGAPLFPQDPAEPAPAPAKRRLSF